MNDDLIALGIFADGSICVDSPFGEQHTRELMHRAAWKLVAETINDASEDPSLVMMPVDVHPDLDCVLTVVVGADASTKLMPGRDSHEGAGRAHLCVIAGKALTRAAMS